jgi:hypothetical protein
MALSPDLIAGSILLSGSGFSGSKTLPPLAQAIGRSVVAWIRDPTSVSLTGSTTGSVGTGQCTGVVRFFGGGFLASGLLSSGLSGPTSAPLGAILETGLVTVLNVSAQYLGVSVGVSVGSDITKIVLANPASLIPLLATNLVGVSIQGIQMAQLSVGLANGISALFLTGTGFGGVTGVAGPYPSTGISTSGVF